MRFFPRPKVQDWEQSRKQGKAVFILRYTLVYTSMFSAMWVVLTMLLRMLLGERPLLSLGDSVTCVLWALFMWNQAAFIWHDNEFKFLHGKPPAA